MKLLLCLIAAASCLVAQNEAALRQALEGKMVVVKIDMPATHLGIDMDWHGDPAMNLKTYSQRVRQFGVSLRNGDSVLITQMRVKANLIEVQLGGGGYGVFGDDTGTVSSSTISKSDYERDLDRQIERETDPRIKARLREQRDRMQRQRERDNARARELDQVLSAQKKQVIAEKRLQAGSRFNLHFPKNYLKESVPSPEEVRQALSEYLDFPSNRPTRPSKTINPPPAISGPGDVRQGMTQAEVYRLMSEPSTTHQARVGDMDQVTATWRQPGKVTEVRFVNGVAVKVSTSTK